MELKLPQLGENVETAEVTRLLVSEGDDIEADQNVVELESEKASFPLPCPHAGRVTKIHVREGETVSVGQTVLEIEDSAAEPKSERSGEEKRKTKSDKGNTEKVPPKDEDREATAEEGKQKKKEEAPLAPREEKPTHRVDEEHEAPAPEKQDDGAPVAAGPATRQLGRELGVDLREVKGSAGGRITREDVKAYVRARMQGPSTAAPSLPDFSRWGEVKRQRLTAIERVAAERLSIAWQIVPHVTQHDVADIADLEAARKQFNAAHDGTKAKLTVTAIIIKAAVVALREFPRFNSSLDASRGELIIKQYYHIGVAVDTERGLLVPVIRDADHKSIVELATELAELADKARDGELAREQMEGGTFTITNLGGIGGTGFTPIINYPEVAILGVSQARREETRLLLPLSLSYDHRAINGADAARFVRRIAGLLSAPFHLLAET